MHSGEDHMITVTFECDTCEEVEHVDVYFHNFGTDLLAAYQPDGWSVRDAGTQGYAVAYCPEHTEVR